ncbi:MAG: decaprenyl-phosphate phosphoribosyltransferase [Bacteroidia bacterium]|nr:decaprenyl-phosphate phosphoribosyltransferase [Bacteroidia bacterium]
MWKAYLELLRPGQYLKNLLLFLPAFFALRIREPGLLLRTLAGFACFCLVASAVYIFNDYLDREADRQHPRKQHRPLASGRVSPLYALLLMGLLLIFGVAGFWLLDPTAFYLISAYVFLNLLYSLRIKHVAIVDIFIISLGFLIRIGTGATVAVPHIPVSMWLVLMIFLGALFLALAKRREDVVLALEGREVRKAIDGYNLEFINGAMVIMASVLTVSYISYAISPEVQARFGSHDLYLTVFFVLLGVLRYMQITFVEGKSGNPSRVFLSDRFLQLTILGWMITFAWLIYR